MTATGHSDPKHDIATISKSLSINLLQWWADRPMQGMVRLDRPNLWNLVLSEQPAMLVAIAYPIKAQASQHAAVQFRVIITGMRRSHQQSSFYSVTAQGVD